MVLPWTISTNLFEGQGGNVSDLFPVPERVSKGAKSAIGTMDSYRAACAHAVADPDGFWLAETKASIRWMKEPTLGLEGSYHDIEKGPLKWFSDGELNITESCLDRFAESQPDTTAIIWEGDEPGSGTTLTYRELHAQVCRAANGLRSMGVGKGDRVIIYMGMVPEAAVAMLACARIGAIHSVIFGGFSAEAIRDRVADSAAEVVITQDEGNAVVK